MYKNVVHYHRDYLYTITDMSVLSRLFSSRRVAWIKTVVFNFHYFPFKAAIHLPVLVYRRTQLSQMGGEIIISVPLKRGLVKLGAQELGTQDGYYSRTIWEVSGRLVINGTVGIGRGSRISIANGATLTLGDKFVITGNSTIICQKEIIFGSDCLLSWDVLVMDTDFHHIYDEEENIVNSPKAIVIGNHVWIGCRNTILKGVSIADDIVVAANSLITREIKDHHCVVGGQGKDVMIMKKGINWRI